jgi:glycosyltransferase involved in cell wall biosynthesis
MVICLITASYPFHIALEDTFLECEVNVIAEKFKNVYVIPKVVSEKKQSIPSSIVLDEGLSKFLLNARELSIKNALRILRNVFLTTNFYIEICKKFSSISSPKNFLWLVKYQIRRKIVEDYFSGWIKKNKLEKRKVIFYTFWLDEVTHGITDAISPYSSSMHAVSRAHGYDIYEERVSPPYWPFRPCIFKNIHSVFADSVLGRDYLKTKYPVFSDRFHVSYMGIVDSGFITPSSNDGVLRIISCSMLRKLKRIDLIIISIKQFSIRYPNIPIEWIHFGNSTSELNASEVLDEIKMQEFPENIKIYFPGYSNQADLLSFYKSNSIDCFITLSESEGTPVSLLEALSCGIPIIATGVGGIVELVSKENGHLLSKNPSADQVADSLFAIYSIRNTDEMESMKYASKSLWRNKYNAIFNYEDFLMRIQNIL